MRHVERPRASPPTRLRGRGLPPDRRRPRGAREHPLLLTLLADGRLHLTAIAKLAPHLTPENREALLNRAAHRTRREIEELVAEIAPRADAPAVMRKLHDRRAGTTSPALSIGPDAEVLSLGRRPEGGASVDRRLRPDGVGDRELGLGPDGVAAREPELRSDGVAADVADRLQLRSSRDQLTHIAYHDPPPPG